VPAEVPDRSHPRRLVVRCPAVSARSCKLDQAAPLALRARLPHGRSRGDPDGWSGVR
jgi:hypothetical protein